VCSESRERVLGVQDKCARSPGNVCSESRERVLGVQDKCAWSPGNVRPESRTVCSESSSSSYFSFTLKLSAPEITVLLFCNSFYNELVALKQFRK
jgi:hypothetical protein